MDIERKPTTAKVNGRLWGARGRDWAEIQEQSCLPVYHEILKRAEVGNTTRYLDVGCGSGMAAGLAAELGADVSGIDASEALLMIAKERLDSASFQLGDLVRTTTAHCTLSFCSVLACMPHAYVY